MPGIVRRIRTEVINILKANPDGVHYNDLVKRTHRQIPDAKESVVSRVVYDLPIRCPDEVYKPERGIYRHVDFQGQPSQPPGKSTAEPPGEHNRPQEQAFYGPFAKWLVENSEECTKAIPLGGSKFKDRWGTPDVIGVRQSRASDIIKFDTEIVTAEIKTDVQGLITAFGQACAYKLFSHKSYIVVPKEAPEEDRARIESLCLIFGIGLVLFDNQKTDDPGFEIRVRPAKHEPDMFYVNLHLKELEDDLFS